MKNFEKIWEVSKDIRGWFDYQEAKQIYSVVAQNKPKRIVELGSYVGRSSIIFSVLAKEFDLDFITVDDLSSKNTKDELIENLKKIEGKYTFLQMKSDEAFQFFNIGAYADRPIDLIFIDTVHTYESVKHDCDLWLPKMRQGGLVLFHDYCEKYHGVIKAVDERKELEKVNLAYTLMTTVKI